MFLVNSRLGLFSATPSARTFQPSPNGAPLLPKLRGHFAEFLNEGSLARLRILSPPTCVGLRYGHLSSSLEAFLGSVGSVTSLLNFSSPSPLRLHVSGFAYSTPYTLGRALPIARLLTLLCHPITQTDYGWYWNIQPVVHRLRLSASA